MSFSFPTRQALDSIQRIIPFFPMHSSLRTSLFFTSLVLPLTVFAGGDGMMNAQSSTPKSAFMMIDDESIGEIDTALPAGHPCAAAGGVWRGWCMNLSEILLGSSGVGIGSAGAMNRTTRETNISTSRARTIRTIESGCRNIKFYVDRRACYRKERARIYSF